MEKKLLMGFLVAGFTLPLQAFSVQNQTTKTVTLSSFVYSVGSTSTRVDRTVTVSPGKSWASEQLTGSTGACTAVVGQKTFNLSGLYSADVVVFFADADGKSQYRIQ